MTEAELRTESILDLLLDDKTFLNILRDQINEGKIPASPFHPMLKLALRISQIAGHYDNLPPDHESLEYSRKA